MIYFTLNLSYAACFCSKREMKIKGIVHLNTYMAHETDIIFVLDAGMFLTVTNSFQLSLYMSSIYLKLIQAIYAVG